MDKINEKKSMATDRILFILEDLSKLQQAFKETLIPAIKSCLSQLDGGINDSYLLPLQREICLRFDHLIEPCLTSLATRISQRLIDNLSSFKQIPSQFRMTNRKFT